MTGEKAHQRSRLLLGAGAAIGILLATAGALNITISNLSGNVLARINGKAIRSHDLAVALARRAGNSRGTPTERLETLNFLIDQELLIQRGVEIGLLESDRTVRKAIAMAMIDAIVAKVLRQKPSEEALRAFYATHQAVFTVPARVHVQQIYFHGNGDLSVARAQAEHAARAIANGMSVVEARHQFGDKDGVPLPDTLLPPQVLRRHLGPTLTRVALAMQVNEISPPLRAPAGYYILRMVQLQPEQIQPYEMVRHEVKAEYVRRARDEALQHYLDRLRREATIVLSPRAPSSGSS